MISAYGNMKETPLLETKKLTKYFGGLTAINGLNLRVNQGEILGLIGPNGAGKTTVFNTISGTFPPTTGQIIFQRKEISHLKPHVITKMGIVRTFQLSTTFMDSSVLENVLLGCHIHTKIGFWGALFRTRATNREEKKALEKTSEIFEFMNLSPWRYELAKNLPHGHQRVLGIAIALATEPKLLLLDEPATGMNPEETVRMMDLISKIRDRGVTILIVEHQMRLVMGLCHRIVVLNYGKKIAEGSPEQIRQNKDVIEAYLGVEGHLDA